MKVIFLPSLFYECAIEKKDGSCTSKFFTHRNPLRSRELCLSYFLEVWLSDETLEAGDVFLRVFARHLRSGERVEILNSANYENTGCYLEPLQREYELYQLEGIKTDVAVWSPRAPLFVSIVPLHCQTSSSPDKKGSLTFLAQEYWLFVRAKEETKLFA